MIKECFCEVTTPKNLEQQVASLQPDLLHLLAQQLEQF